MRLRNAFKCSVFEISELVSTKTLLLKHYYRRSKIPVFQFTVCTSWFCAPLRLVVAVISGQLASGRCSTSRLSGPLNQLNAILSLLQPLDRYRTPSAIGSAIGRPLSRPISLSCTGGSPQPPRSKPFRGLNRAIVAL